MPTERERMLHGELYLASDPELVQLRRSIGDGTTIGAGSVVTRDLEPGVLAVGNPCRALRHLSR